MAENSDIKYSNIYFEIFSHNENNVNKLKKSHKY